MHESGLVHRDIKHLNILVSRGGVEKVPQIRIIDLGMTVKLEENQMFSKFGGTIGYMAPEVIRGEPCDYKVDIWSLGVILFSLITARAPAGSGSL